MRATAIRGESAATSSIIPPATSSRWSATRSAWPASARAAARHWHEQRAAQQVGIQRDNSIQQHIDSYARPYGFGYGFGFGAFGGFN